MKKLIIILLYITLSILLESLIAIAYYYLFFIIISIVNIWNINIDLLWILASLIYLLIISTISLILSELWHNIFYKFLIIISFPISFVLYVIILSTFYI